jgi:hypothetical protein
LQTGIDDELALHALADFGGSGLRSQPRIGKAEEVENHRQQEDYIAGRIPIVLVAVTTIAVTISNMAVVVVTFAMFMAMLMFMLIVVIVIVSAVLLVMVMVSWCRSANGAQPEGDRPDGDEHNKGNAAPKDRLVELRRQNIAEQVLVPEHDGYATEQAADANRAELLEVIGRLGFSMRM